jgi:SAM-dependent methyltransferase
MSSVFGRCRSMYRALLPLSVRNRLYLLMPLPFQRLRIRMVSRLQRHIPHDEIYDREYYLKSVEPEIRISAGVMAKTIIDEFSPGKVVDVGCGTGALLAALQESNVSCAGLEYAQAAIDICTRRGLAVRKFDLESDAPCIETADLVVSTEVAEHLPESIADRYVGLLCEIAPIAVMTAASPNGPAGTDHVNEQPNEYWIEKFAKQGYQFDANRSLRWREDWRTRNVSGIYHRTLMIFQKDKLSEKLK